MAAPGTLCFTEVKEHEEPIYDLCFKCDKLVTRQKNQPKQNKKLTSKQNLKLRKTNRKIRKQEQQTRTKRKKEKRCSGLKCR